MLFPASYIATAEAHASSLSFFQRPCNSFDITIPFYLRPMALKDLVRVIVNLDLPLAGHPGTLEP